MAFIFELTVNFSEDLQSAENFRDYIKNKRKTIIFEGKEIILDDATVINYPNVPGKSNNYEVFVSVCDERDEIAKQDLSEIGKELYTLLKGISGYVFALVGWEVDGNTLDDYITGWSEDIIDGSLEGFVISHKFINKLPSRKHFIPFEEGYDWIPYHGTPKFKFT